MISLSHNFLFIHIPKTGGNSVQSVLLNYSNSRLVTSGSRHQDGQHSFGIVDNEFGLTKHSTLMHYEAVVPTPLFERAYKFATIRNPWDRALSFFLMPSRYGLEGRPVTDRRRFKKSLLRRLDKLQPVRHYITLGANTGGASHLGADDSAYEGDLAYHMTKLIRFEHLQQDFSQVCTDIGIPGTQLPKLNASQHRYQHYGEYFDDEIRDIIGEKYQEEIAYGRYTF